MNDKNQKKLTASLIGQLYEFGYRIKNGNDIHKEVDRAFEKIKLLYEKS